MEATIAVPVAAAVVDADSHGWARRLIRTATGLHPLMSQSFVITLSTHDGGRINGTERPALLRHLTRWFPCRPTRPNLGSVTCRFHTGDELLAATHRSPIPRCTTLAQHHCGHHTDTRCCISQFGCHLIPRQCEAALHGTQAQQLITVLNMSLAVHLRLPNRVSHKV